MTNETLKNLVNENLDEFVKWLDDNGLQYELRNIKENNPT